jgi:hypothetical protein
MTATNSYAQACFDAWMNCENLLVTVAGFQRNISKKVTNVVDECALICMGTFQALKKSSSNMSRLAVLCVGICEECAELCEERNEAHFRECARKCRECSETMSRAAFTDWQ